MRALGLQATYVGGSAATSTASGAWLVHEMAGVSWSRLMEATLVELGPTRRLTARDAGADVVITAPPRDESTRWFLVGLFAIPCIGLAALAIAVWSTAPAMSMLAVAGAAVCGWIAIGLLRDRRRDRARHAAGTGERLILRAQDAVVRGPGDREQVISLDAVLQHPLLERRDDATVALVRARQALVNAKPGRPRRLVLEAAAIEAAVLGGFGADAADERVFVVLLRGARATAVSAVVTGERNVAELVSEAPSCWVYAVPTAVHADSMRYPILDVARVIEWKKPADAAAR